mmetsp:Transcript_17979/g.58827  ORF Transcript_17979/g.58827 Transcript_17979/m.58827 type:complete len:138 (-) Transcript_17979:331-744(-)
MVEAGPAAGLEAALELVLERLLETAVKAAAEDVLESEVIDFERRRGAAAGAALGGGAARKGKADREPGARGGETESRLRTSPRLPLGAAAAAARLTRRPGVGDRESVREATGDGVLDESGEARATANSERRALRLDA